MDGRPQKKSPAPVGPGRFWVWYLVITAFLFFFASRLFNSTYENAEIPYSQFLDDLQAGKIARVTIADSRISGQLKAGKGEHPKVFITTGVPDPDLVKELRQQGVVFSAQEKSFLWSFLVSWILPFLLVYLVFGLLSQRYRGGAAGGLFGLTKSKAKVYVEKDTKTTFADVAGVEEAKAELQEVVGFLKEPGQYTRLGGRAPKGILLIGPPGTGKTLLARAVAGEAHVPFFSINGSEFVEMFVGLGAARVRDLFEQATRSAPCLVFIDELDAIGRFRGGAIPGIPGNDEKEQTLNQLLAEMDGFDSRKGVIILAATNRPEVLDPAILRAGRFDRQVLVSIPDKEGRRQILQVHVKGVPLDETVQLENIAALTPGFSGADLANLVNESALHAARRKAKAVSEKDFIEAIERIVAGIEQRRKVINPEEKRRIAFHELGHATVALSRKTDVKVQKVSIIARGLGALGYTLQRPSEDRYLMDEDELMNKIAVLLGGRASEKVFFAKLSTGAADDLVKATDLARAMVTQFGLSKKIGVATYEKPSVRFLAGPAQGIETREPSEKMREMIDSEINAFLERGLQLAEESVESNRLFIEKGAQVLLEVETLDEAQVGDLWRRFGKPLGETKHLAVG